MPHSALRAGGARQRRAADQHCVDTTRLSGSVSTGSHGVGRGWGAVSDLVDSLTIVDGGGRPVVYNASHPYFNQARAAPRAAAFSKHPVCSQTGVWLRIPAARSKEQGPVYFHFRSVYRCPLWCCWSGAVLRARQALTCHLICCPAGSEQAPLHWCCCRGWRPWQQQAHAHPARCRDRTLPPRRHAGAHGVRAHGRHHRAHVPARQPGAGAGQALRRGPCASHGLWVRE
jgi:hypothetical protein